MNSASRRPRRTKNQWFHYIQQFLRHNLPAEAFCEQHDLGAKAFERWRLQYLKEHQHPCGPKPPSFTEVAVPAVKTNLVPVPPTAVLHIGGALRLELHQIDTAALTTLIRGLQHG